VCLIYASLINILSKECKDRSIKDFLKFDSMKNLYWVPARIRVILKSENSQKPGLNFINVLCTAFTLADPKNIKKTVKLSIFFTLLRSTSVKAVHIMLMKLSPDGT
jgi:hypothetical protein